MIAGVILAAGASSRMGSPKALLRYGEEGFAERLVRVFAAYCHPVIVVLGYGAEALRPYVETFPAKPVVVVNPAPERGQLSSLQTALRALPADAEGFLFVPVDCPAPTEETIAKIVAAFVDREPGTQLVIPQFEDRRGHPVCASRQIAEQLLALPPTDSAREVIHRHRANTVYVAVSDPGILADVDDRAAYESLKLSMR